MSRFNRILSVVLMGLPAPVLLMLLGWWGLIPFNPANSVYYIVSAAGGFLIGIILDATLLKKLMLGLFSLQLPVLCALMAFYSVLIYGFFMGFPVFNILPGIMGGYIAVKGDALQKADITAARITARRVNLFSFVILLVLCVSTSYLTLRESTIQSQLRSMLGLPFTVTYPMIWGTILIGGTTLLLLQHLLSCAIQKRVVTSI